MTYFNAIQAEIDFTEFSGTVLYQDNNVIFKYPENDNRYIYCMIDTNEYKILLLNFSYINLRVYDKINQISYNFQSDKSVQDFANCKDALTINWSSDDYVNKQITAIIKKHLIESAIEDAVLVAALRTLF